ncbi:MAG: hypothetical protein NC094_03990 [Bacteroidales bacterium]|nr:hypothetical protein [Lachnoclostridium sp.]MCM1383216.1 hypothetical protein [Lachnoclostridium sp.]MCM1464559.1 hypothetical protein [Bacteroidales bacterium]
MQNVIFLPFAMVLFFVFRMIFKRAVFYHAGRKEWITDIKWYHYVMYYALMAFFTGVLLIPFFPETVMQIGKFYELHQGKTFVSVNDKELDELNKGLPGLPYKEEVFKYEVLSSVKPAKLVDVVFPETIEYQRQLKQLWVDIGLYSAVQYDFDKEFEVHYDTDNKNYYILADGKKFADMEVKRTMFFKVIYAHYYWAVLLDDES